MNTGAQPAAAAAPDLCHGQETVVFSCRTAEGIASMCQSPDRVAPKLQYRFGTTREVIFAYPAVPAPPRGLFTGDMLILSGGGGAYLQFEQNRLRYTIFSAIGRWGAGGAPREAAGVAIADAGSGVTSHVCLGETTSVLGPHLFSTLGLSGSTQGFDIPDAFMAH